MTIRPASDSPAAAAAAVGPVRSDAASAEGPRSDTAPAGAAPSEGDRLEISDAARARAAGAPEAGSLEIEVARLALRQGGEMDAARLHELRERVRTGYYDNPPAIDRIAEAAARDLAE
ncbi:flagellar biosynthesis anti-sigma factor FlgM [Rubrivirga marina]|uniref:Uncharacterized protein n=1 Tax=Rubrivirga marina TaxID=1196024 RepID=A0A271IX22_9BACT|nr:flagellar biosynthesis anti-sigma factor FlgM [Rubrivirga marina]PAP75776.1 hypothetical protein BSZ37_04635 [Rubrivirga marina]